MQQSHPYQTIAKLLLRSIDQKDWNVVESLMHPKAKYEVSGYKPFLDRDAVMNYYRNLWPIASGEHYIESMMVGKGKAILWGRFVGKKVDGYELLLNFADLLFFDENKKIKQRRVYNCELKTY